MSRIHLETTTDDEDNSSKLQPLSIACSPPIPSSPSYLSRHPHLKPVIYIFFIYLLGGGLILYSKWFYNNNCPNTKDPLVKSFKYSQHNSFCPGYGFPFPLFASCIHFTICFLVAAFFIHVLKHPIPPISGHTFLTRVLPLGICMGGYIALLNSAYLFIDASYLVEMKQVGIVLTFFLACAIGLERMTFKLCCLVFVVASGLLIASYGASHFSLEGAALVFSACIFSSIHEVLVQLLAQHGTGSVHHSSPQHFSPFAIMYLQSPIALVTLLPWTIWLDIPRLKNSHFTHDMAWQRETIFIVVAGGIGICCYVLAHFAFVEVTSALTYAMAHAFLSLAIIAISTAIFGSSITTLNIVGYSTAFAGIIAYYTIRAREQLQEEKRAQYANRISLTHSDWSKSSDDDRVSLLANHTMDVDKEEDTEI